MPSGRGYLASPRSTAGRARSIRRSISRTPLRYSSSLRRSAAPSVWLELSGVLADEVEDALAASIGSWRWSSAAAGLAGLPKRRSKTSRGLICLATGVDLAPPREVRLIGTAIAVVAFAGILAALAADLQRGEPRCLADAPGGRAGRRRSRAEVGAVGLPGVAAGQEAGHGAGVVAPAVAEGPRRVQGQAAQDEQILLDRLRAARGSPAAQSAAPVDRGVQSGMWTPLGT